MSNTVYIECEVDLSRLELEDLVDELKDRIEDGLTERELKILKKIEKLRFQIQTPYNSLNNEMAIEWFEKITQKYSVWELEKMIPA